MLVRRRISAFSGMALLGLLAAAFVACTGQGANERCNLERGGEDPSVGPSDCNSGLICVSGSTLGQNADVCCPKDVTQRTGICLGKGTTGSDTGVAETAVSDASDADADAAEADATDADATDADAADASGDADASDASDASDAG